MSILNKCYGALGSIVNTTSKFAIFIRFVAILFVPLYILFLFKYIEYLKHVKSAIDWYSNPFPHLFYYFFPYFIEAFFRYLFYGILCNFGLYFITTNRAKTYKVFATLFYLPTILATPVIIGRHLDWYGYLFYIWPLFVYWWFYPWRR